MFSRKSLQRSSSVGIAVIIVTAFIVHGGALRNAFVQWDDGYLITENPIVRGVTWENVKAAFTQYDPELYIPLTYLSYQTDYAVWGMHPFGFHLTNLVLHTLNAVLVFFLVNLLLESFQLSAFSFQENPKNKERRTGNEPTSQRATGWTALAIALLWAVHPLNVEAVAWASARKDLLSGFFFLLSVCLCLCFRNEQRANKQRPALALYAGSIIAFFLGLLAKVSIAPLPLVLLLLEWFLPRHPLPFKGEGRVRVLKRISPYLLLSVVFGVVAVMGKTRNVASTSLLESFLLGAKSTIFYLQKLFLPVRLSVLYPYTDAISLGNPDLLFPLLLAISLLALAWLARRRFPLFAFAIGWYVLLLLPSFTTFRKGDDIELDLYFASDRYAYLPSIGIIFLVASLGAALCTRARTHGAEMRRRNIAIGFVGAGVVSLGILSFRQAQTWQTTEALFQNAIYSYPNAHIAHNNLGLFEQGREQYDNAIAHYRKAIAIRPTGRTYYNLGLAYIAQGERRKALEANRLAIQINPRHARAHLNLGGLLLEDGKLTEALEELDAAIIINPDLSLAHFNRGVAYERWGRLFDAENAYAAAIEKAPDDIEALVSLAALFVRNRQLDDALVLLKRAISLQPHHPRYESLLIEIARLQGTKMAL